MMKTTLTYDHLYHYEELTESVKKLAALRPEFVKLNSLAVTPKGRDIWEFEITDPSTGACSEKAAYYVDGNEHAGEVTGSMAALYFADYLITNADEQEVAELLRQTAFYIIPRKSPDGAEHYLTTPDAVRSLDRLYPYTEEMPGLQPADIDGDGIVRNMRIRTPFGAWKVSPKDPRVLTRRLPDDLDGEFYNVYKEGYMVDWDGAHIAQAHEKFGYDDNRNYPVSWAPENEQHGAGEYPLCNIETKTSADFMIKHRNIASVITFHTHGGMFLFPPGMCPTKDVFAEDIARYKEIGKIGEQETGYAAKNLFDDFTPEGERISSGAFDDWCHYDRGIPAYTIELWDLDPRAGIPHVWPLPAEESPEKGESDLMKELKWVDENVPENPFMPWTPFEHPQLGPVEIGGFDYKYVFQNCPPKFLLQECEKNTRFMLRHAKMLPKLCIDKVDVTKLAEGVYRIDAFTGNRGYLPTYLTREAVKRGINQAVKVTLEGAKVLEGKKTQSIGDLQGFSGINTGYSWDGIGTFDHEPFIKKTSWIAAASEGQKITVKAFCPTAGSDRIDVIIG